MKCYLNNYKKQLRNQDTKTSNVAGYLLQMAYLAAL